MMNCRKATRLMSDAQERKLTFSERANLKVHVMMCSACHNFGKQMDVLRELSRAYVKEPDSGDEAPSSQKNDTNPD